MTRKLEQPLLCHPSDNPRPTYLGIIATLLSPMVINIFSSTVTGLWVVIGHLKAVFFSLVLRARMLKVAYGGHRCWIKFDCCDANLAPFLLYLFGMGKQRWSLVDPPDLHRSALCSQFIYCCQTKDFVIDQCEPSICGRRRGTFLEQTNKINKKEK